MLEAGSGQQALELAARHEGPIDLLLTDVVMPRMNGREVRDRIAALRPGLPVLYMSGYAAELSERHVALEPGAPSSPTGKRCTRRPPEASGPTGRPGGPPQRACTLRSAASAAPRAPAMSRSGTTVKRARRSCSSLSAVFSRTLARNHSRKCAAASTTPPPTK